MKELYIKQQNIGRKIQLHVDEFEDRIVVCFYVLQCFLCENNIMKMKTEFRSLIYSFESRNNNRLSKNKINIQTEMKHLESFCQVHEEMHADSQMS